MYTLFLLPSGFKEHVLVHLFRASPSTCALDLRLS